MRGRLTLATLTVLGLGGCGTVATSPTATSGVAPVDPPAAVTDEAVVTDPGTAAAVPTPAGPSLSSVSDAAAELDAGLDGDVTAVVVDLATGERTGHRGGTAFTSASLYKLYVVATALDQVDTGDLALDAVVGGGCGTVARAAELAITVSDNACAISLGSMVGWDQVEDYVERESFSGTTFHPVEHAGGWGTAGQETTADDTADLLVRLAEGDLLGAESTTFLLTQLDGQYFDSALSLTLADDDAAFGHKLGTLAEVSHDAGILTMGGRRYVVAVLTGGWPGHAEPAAEPALAGVGEALRAFAAARADASR
ncbi:hypothetical protein BJF86_02870 [Serinicoccus sp. CNJ-927]|uniref:serine hydrolase n=1 Tax=Serinicoccus sp. CNJ-927 TaxID=1904970 RepID=UPI000960D36A|nr:serine hydrolase [Serinicoccus sp. CNJ-927]OLT41956.1 hypothetical protein BJF86_02870 [Serinicoccus sp. CNJ-927]